MWSVLCYQTLVGGMLTNFETIKASIARLRKIDQMKEKGELDFYTKKERASIDKDYLRLSEYLGGIRDMKTAPAAMFVVDLPKEHIAVAEAKRMGIPVIAIADSNSDPESIDFPIPGNDDAIRSIKLFTNLIADSYIEGAKEYEQKLRTQTDKGSDLAKEKEASAKDTTAEKKGRAPKGRTAETQKAGPEVIKATKQRKLVAAGMAEVVEIQAELENPETSEEESEN